MTQRLAEKSARVPILLPEVLETMFGLLNIQKPKGITSRKVVDHVQRLVKPAKAGHAGTLDPLATGVLVVCVGAATRLISLVQEQRKTYRGQFRLGQTSDTDDSTGQVIEVPNTEPVSQSDLEAALQPFLGEIQQVPPQFSAVHIQGKRAYELARSGQAVTIAPKTVQVHRIELLSYTWPEFALEIECGSGTYVRSIGRDVGQALGCGALMTDLIRTRIGPFDIADAIALDDLDADSLPNALLSPRLAVADLPGYSATLAECQRLKQGQRIKLNDFPENQHGDRIAVFTPENELAALAEFQPQTAELVPRQVFLQ